MAIHLLQQYSLSHLCALLLLLLLTYAANASEVFLEEPADISVIIGSPVFFQCRINEAVLLQLPSKVASWYRIKGSQAEEIHSGLEDRIFVDGSPSMGIFDLRLDYTSAADAGTMYICSFNETASRTASLNVLPESWKPTCLIYPTTEVRVGEIIEVICTSDGDSRTELLWQKNNIILEGTVKTVSGKAVSLSYSETQNEQNDVSSLYTCIASLNDMVQSEVCTVGPIQVIGKPSKTGAYIPYIIVGLLSVVVSMLFLTLLVVLFRHRRCRMCQREPPEPQTVLDMAALQNGPPLFYPIHQDSDDGADDGIGRSPPPDVIPTVAPPVVNNKRKGKPKSKSVVDRSGQSRRPKQHQQQQQQRREGNRVNRSQTTRERNSQARNNAKNQRQTAAAIGPGAPLRRTSSNTTLQGNIDDRTKDKTVTGKKKLTMTNYVKSSGSKSSGSKQGKKAASVKHQPSSRNAKAKQKPRGQGNRQSAYQVQLQRGEQKRDEDAKSLKQLNIDTTTAVVPSSSSSQQDRPGPSGAASFADTSIADTSIDTNDISVEISIEDPATGSSLNDLGNSNLSSRDSDLRRSGGQSLYQKNVGSRPVSQDLNNPDLQQVAAGSSASTSGVSEGLNSDKVVYASLDFQKPVGLNILPDV